MRTILLISPYWKEPHRWMVSTVKMAELWQRLGYAVEVACMGAKTETTMAGDTLSIHSKKDLFIPDPWNYGIAFGFSGFVNRLAKREKPDLIVINKLLFWSSLSIIGLKLRGKRVIVLTDALVGITWWPKGRLPKIAAAIYAWTLGWLVLKLADKVILFHPQPERVMRRLGIAERAEVIPTGIDPAPFGRAKGQGPSSKDGKVLVTYVGRLESVKGVDDFLAAVVPLKKAYPNLEVKVVGWYPSTSSGQARHPLVTEYGDDVHFTGLRDDIPAILGETDIFVLPSLSEGLSNALMEAMASGCACIASDVGGNAFLLQNGVSGFLFPPRDREALAAHIRRLLDDPAKRRAMGEAARKRIEEEFSWEKVGEKYRKLFESFIEESA